MALSNGESIERIPVLEIEAFRQEIVQAVRAGARVLALFLAPLSPRRMVAVVGDGTTGTFSVLSTIAQDSYLGAGWCAPAASPSISPRPRSQSCALGWNGHFAM
jgi:hypothetical protein